MLRGGGRDWATVSSRKKKTKGRVRKTILYYCSPTRELLWKTRLRKNRGKGDPRKTSRKNDWGDVKEVGSTHSLQKSKGDRSAIKKRGRATDPWKKKTKERTKNCPDERR